MTQRSGSFTTFDIDVGNTRSKWRALGGDVVVDRGSGLESLWTALRQHAPIARIRVASVQSMEQQHALGQMIQRVSGARPVFAKTARECSGVAIAYARPEQLGVDRWLAMVAAYRHCQAALMVADVGSALTIDVVDRDGRHRGGYIVPGARLMAESLMQGTGQVRFDLGKAAALQFEPAIDTAGCVSAGCGLALASAVAAAHRLAESELGEPVRLMLAGGDALAIQSGLAVLLGGAEPPLAPEIVQDLVLDGLRWALP